MDGKRDISEIRIDNIEGANIIVGSSQTVHGDLTIKVGAIAAASEDVRKRINELFSQLMTELEKISEDKAKEVKAVKIAAEDAVSEANRPEPDKDRLEIRGDALVQAAKNLLSVAPIAVQIAKTLLMIG